jgi:hypothetical protein
MLHWSFSMTSINCNSISKKPWDRKAWLKIYFMFEIMRSLKDKLLAQEVIISFLWVVKPAEICQVGLSWSLTFPKIALFERVYCYSCVRGPIEYPCESPSQSLNGSKKKLPQVISIFWCSNFTFANYSTTPLKAYCQSLTKCLIPRWLILWSFWATLGIWRM